ncbi:MAG: DoxX family protein, partial [Proteobacteria bacterium]
MSLPWHLYAMAAVYLLAGLNHFRNPRMYQRIIPDYFPYPKTLNVISGIAEIVLAILLCIPSVSK